MFAIVWDSVINLFMKTFWTAMVLESRGQSNLIAQQPFRILS